MQRPTASPLTALRANSEKIAEALKGGRKASPAQARGNGSAPGSRRRRNSRGVGLQVPDTAGPLWEINSPFGWSAILLREAGFPNRHKAPRRIIKAAKSGRVEYAGWMGGYGRVVVIRHSDGLSTLYAHCSSLSVRNGESISQGQTVAAVGTTGRTTGPHLHFEVRKGKSPTNPLALLK